MLRKPQQADYATHASRNRPIKLVMVVVVAATANYLRLASQNLGKYLFRLIIAETHLDGGGLYKESFAPSIRSELILLAARS